MNRVLITEDNTEINLLILKILQEIDIEIVSTFSGTKGRL